MGYSYKFQSSSYIRQTRADARSNAHSHLVALWPLSSPPFPSYKLASHVETHGTAKQYKN